MTLDTVAYLGSFTFYGNEGVVPGSDTFWSREPAIQITRAMGARTDNVLRIAMGSRKRTFTVQLSPDRFAELELLLGVTASFTDWLGDTRIVYIQTIKQSGGSRPFLFNVEVGLVEQ